MEAFDLVVIGSGPVGEKGAAQAAYYGKGVALVEQSERVGGAPVKPGRHLDEDAARDGAVPDRLRAPRDLRRRLAPDLTLDRLRRRRRAVSDTAMDAVRLNLARHGIDVVRGTATLGPDRRVTVTAADGTTRTLRGDVILVATGSRPLRPPGIPFDAIPPRALLLRVNAVLRGWANYFKHGCPRQVQLPRLVCLASSRVLAAPTTPRHLVEGPTPTVMRGWDIVIEGAILLMPSTITVSRYRYRGTRIPTTWTETALNRHRGRFVR